MLLLSPYGRSAAINAGYNPSLEFFAVNAHLEIQSDYKFRAQVNLKLIKLKQTHVSMF